jgi:hypothetical protein
MFVTPDQMVIGLLLPAAIVAVAMIFAWQPWRRNPPDGRWIGGPAIAVGFVIAFVKLVDNPLKSTDWDRWTALLMVPAALVALIDALWRRRRMGIRLIPVAALGLALGWLELPPAQGDSLAARVHLLSSIGVAACVLLIWWLSLEQVSRSMPGMTGPLALWLAAAGVAVTMATIVSINEGLAVASIATMAAAAAMVAWWSGRTLALDRGAALVAAVAVVGAMVVAFAPIFTPGNTTLNRIAILLAGLSPLGVWIGEIPYLNRGRRFRRAALRLIPIAMAVIAAVVISVWVYRQTSQEM